MSATKKGEEKEEKASVILLRVGLQTELLKSYGLVFSRVIRDFTPRYVSRLVGWSDGWLFSFLLFWRF